MASAKQAQTANTVVEEVVNTVADEAASGTGASRSRDERKSRQLVPQREKRLGRTCLTVAFVDGHNPGCVRVLSVHMHCRSGNRLTLSCRVRPGCANAEAAACLPHQVGHVQLRGVSRLEAGEVHVLGCRDDPSPRRGRDGDPHEMS